jgi:hypothetical protein
VCQKSGPQVTDATELLLRQVYEKWLEEDGQPSSMAFYPWRDVDDGCLSVDRAALTTAEDAFVRFTSPQPTGFGQSSVGVWGLTVGETEAVGLSVWEDPVATTATAPANPAHALLEFGSLEKKRWKSTGRVLKLNARARGRLYAR